MGIKVTTDKVVSCDDDHEKRVNTSIHSNPTKKFLGAVPVQFLLKRNRTGDQERDGNPLIYALKGMRGYSMTAFHRNALTYRVGEIALKVSDTFDADFILPLPSSSGVCHEFAHILSDATCTPVISNDFLSKTTIEQAIIQAKQIDQAQFNDKQRHEWNKMLAAWSKQDPSETVSLKDIDLKLRKYINPFMTVRRPKYLIGKKVCVFDDLMASGVSIRCTANLLADLGCSGVEAFCLLSDIK